jgi:GH25 family lysozyme M1 (1,4-beta-N-acetylmuramidase)
MIVGNDISEFQGQINWTTYSTNTNFVVMKASEGSSYIDSWFGNNRQQSRLLNIPRGFYHFARPDLGNSPQAEATFFCKLIDGDPIKKGEFIALDFEVTYTDCVNWCKAWLDAVSTHFNGIKPLIYLNQSQAASFDWNPLVNAGYTLWLASYNPDGYGNTGTWPFMVMQQTSSSQQVPGISGSVDRDVFFGDVVALQKYGFQPVVTPPAPTPPPAPSPAPNPVPPPVSTPPAPAPQPPNPVPTPPVPPVYSPSMALSDINKIVNHSSWLTYLAGRTTIKNILQKVGYL